MPPPSISFSVFPIFNFPESPRIPPRQTGRILLAQANPQGRDERPPVASDAVVVAPETRGRGAVIVPVYTLAELTEARRERERVFSDALLLGVHLSPWNSGRNATYQNISLTILRMRYFLEGRQADTFSIRAPLLSWVRRMGEEGDGIFQDTFDRIRAALHALREPFNRERADRLLRLMDEVQRTIARGEETASAEGSSPDLPVVPSPQTGSQARLTPPVAQGSNPPPVVPGVRPINFTSSASRTVSTGDEMMRDLRDHAIRAARQAAQVYGRRTGRPVDFTLRLHIHYNTDRAGWVAAQTYRGGDRDLVQQILEAVSRNLPRFQGHGGDAVQVPLHIRID